MLSRKIERLEERRSFRSTGLIPLWIFWISGDLTFDCVLPFFSENGVENAEERVEITVALGFEENSGEVLNRVHLFQETVGQVTEIGRVNGRHAVLLHLFSEKII